jgi:lipoprotein-anchoring transpeptidase ErfK/SrfK
MLSFVFGWTLWTQQLPAPDRLIAVSLKEQKLVALERGEPVMEFFCSTGRRNGTPKGSFPIRDKRIFNRALPEYGGMQIPYSLRLDVLSSSGRRRRIAIHAHPSVPRRPASHGCIRLKKSDAKKLFEWAKVGDVVVVE